MACHRKWIYHVPVALNRSLGGRTRTLDTTQVILDINLGLDLFGFQILVTALCHDYRNMPALGYVTIVAEGHADSFEAKFGTWLGSTA